MDDHAEMIWTLATAAALAATLMEHKDRREAAKQAALIGDHVVEEFRNRFPQRGDE